MLQIIVQKLFRMVNELSDPNRALPVSVLLQSQCEDLASFFVKKVADIQMTLNTGAKDESCQEVSRGCRPPKT